MNGVSELTPEERAALAYYDEYEPPEPVRHEPRFRLLRRLLAPFAAIGALLVKFGGLLFKAKFFFSIFISAAFYVWFGGWWFGIGLVVLLFVHEMGHVLEAKRQGLPVSSAALHPVPRRDDHDEADAAGRLERGEGRDRRAARRLGRRRGVLDRRRADELEPPARARLPRLPDQPVQPAAGGAARRRPDRGCAPSRALARRLPRPARRSSSCGRTRS